METALDKVLEAYRDMFGVRSDAANEIHRDACAEVWRLRNEKDAEIVATAELQNNFDGYTAAARVIALWLDKFCDKDLPYDQMIAQAARGAAKHIEKQDAEIVRLRNGLEAFLIAYDNEDSESDGNELLDRLEAIGEGDRWATGEDLQPWAVEKARALLAEGGTS